MSTHRLMAAVLGVLLVALGGPLRAQDASDAPAPSTGPDEPSTPPTEHAASNPPADAMADDPAPVAPPADAMADDPAPVTPPALAGAATPPDAPSTEPAAAPAESRSEDASGRALHVAPFGQVEMHHTWSFRNPDNGIIALRGFDNRHATFTLSNIVAGADLRYGDVYARLVLQWGNTGATYYLGEPADLGGLGVSGSGPEYWRILQEAYAGYSPAVGQVRIPIEAGLFLSPIGVEDLNVYGQWHYSRTNLFYGLPFYHTGVRARVELGSGWNAGVALYNGWNSVIDNNRNKSVALHVGYQRDDTYLSLLYFGGNERDHEVAWRGWRHLFDFSFATPLTRWLAVQGQVDGGFEPGPSELLWWFATNLDVKVEPLRWLAFALRGDFFRDATGRATGPLFWAGARWISSVTATTIVRPTREIELFVEVRRDQAESPVFYGGADSVPSHLSQTTLTIGLVGALSGAARVPVGGGE